MAFFVNTVAIAKADVPPFSQIPAVRSGQIIVKVDSTWLSLTA
jgi:hypothetical protein